MPTNAQSTARQYAADGAPASETISYLAGVFADVIHEWTTPAEFAEIKRRNATPEYATCCATHDFMDANDAMVEAFRRAFGDEAAVFDDANGNPGKDVALWNAAWDQAKRGWIGSDAARDTLSTEYTGWLRAQGLEDGDAMEHLMGSDLTADQRQWLTEFAARWEAAEDES